MKNKWLYIIAGFALLGYYWKVKEMELFARTIYGEARGEGLIGMVAVAWAIMNRANSGRWYGGSLTQVILRPFQFSLWNHPDANYKATIAADENDPAYQKALSVAQSVIDGTISDPTKGATHYHTTDVKPDWVATGEVTARIGNHIFYKGVA